MRSRKIHRHFLVKHRKKNKPKIRKKVKIRLFRKTLFFLSLAVFSAASAVSLKHIYDVASLKIRKGEALFKIKAVEAFVGEESVRKDIRRILSGFIGRKWSGGLEREICSEIKKSHPYIENLEIGINFLTGKLSAEGTLEKFVADALVNGKKAYIALSGKTYGSIYGDCSGCVAARIKTDGKTSLSNFAAFADRMRKAGDSLFVKPVEIRYNAVSGDCVVILEDGTAVSWGDFEPANSKISRLNEVLSDAAGKFPPPYKVDLRHFPAGKIYVSPENYRDKT